MFVNFLRKSKKTNQLEFRCQNVNRNVWLIGKVCESLYGSVRRLVNWNSKLEFTAKMPTGTLVNWKNS